MPGTRPVDLGLAWYCLRSGTGAQYGLVSLPRISQDFRGAPHHILTSHNRHICPVTHIVPCSSLWAGAATACPHPAPQPHLVLLSCMAPGALARAHSQLRKVRASFHSLLLPDSESEVLNCHLEETLVSSHPGSSKPVG